MPDNIRMKRIESFFRKELSRIVSRELKDPVFEDKLISFTQIKISRDLSSAQVYVSVLGGGDNNGTPSVVIALNKAVNLIRSEILAVSDLRRIPHFKFHEDYAIEAASKIESLLNTIEIPPEEEETPEE